MLNVVAFISLALAGVTLALGWFTDYLSLPLWGVIVVGAIFLAVAVFCCFFSALKEKR